jgi:uncharacterized protein
LVTPAVVESLVAMSLRMSGYHVSSQTFFDEDDGVVKRMVFSTRTATAVVISEQCWVRVCMGSLEELPAPMVTELRKIELLVPADEDELTTVLARQRAASSADDRLAVVVQPTAACQLACGYCGQEHSRTHLSEAHQDLFIDSTRRKLDARPYRTLGVAWFGAEPLAGLHVMRRMSPRLRTLAAEFGCAYASSITTNGLSLTDDIATELIHTHAVGAVTISIDGLRDAHNARRPTKSGGPSFDRILANLVRLCRRTDLDIAIDVRANIDRRNVDQVTPLLRLLASANVQDRIHFYAVPVHSWGNDAHERSLSPEEFADEEIGWFIEMARLGFRVAMVPALTPVVCIAVRPDSEVIDATGEVYNCTEVSYVPAYGKPNRFGVGHVETARDAARRAFSDFHDLVAAGAYDCSTCRMLPVCGGACPKQWLEGRAPCPSAKRNIEDRLLLAYALSRAKEHSIKAVA